MGLTELKNRVETQELSCSQHAYNKHVQKNNKKIYEIKLNIKQTVKLERLFTK